MRLYPSYVAGRGGCAVLSFWGMRAMLTMHENNFPFRLNNGNLAFGRGTTLEKFSLSPMDAVAAGADLSLRTRFLWHGGRLARRAPAQPAGTGMAYPAWRSGPDGFGTDGSLQRRYSRWQPNVFSGGKPDCRASSAGQTVCILSEHEPAGGQPVAASARQWPLSSPRRRESCEYADLPLLFPSL